MPYMIHHKDPKNQPGKQISLNSSQKLAVEHVGGPVLVTAGAGSGKTRTLTQRVVYLIEKHVNPGKILAITFTNKAADEMRNRILKDLKQKVSTTPLIGTFHSLGARILRKESKYLGRTLNYSIYDADDSEDLIKKILKMHESKKVWLNKPAVMSKKISQIKDSLTDIDEIEEDFVKDIYQKYEEALKNHNAFDFDDLIEKVVRLFRENPSVLKKYQSLWDYVLVDECQDINLTQYELLKLLAGEHKNLFVIGDDHQAIYGFRNADFRYFLNFEKDWPGAKIIALGENYRSTANIVNGAAGVIQNNKLQRPKKLWTENIDGPLIKIIGSYDPDDEAQTIVEEISNYAPVLRDVAILYRTNAQSRAIEQALNFNSIPYEIFGGVKFYERKEIKDVVSALRYASNPKDGVALGRLDKTFTRGIFRELRADLPKMGKNLSLLELVGYFLKTSDYFDYLDRKFINHEERTENIEELIRFASTFSSLQDFLERVSLLQSTDKIKRTENENPVKLMTIHLSKGLEFSSVYIIGASEGILPHQRSLSEEGGLEEERRLMYVAMTRAREKLSISFYDVASRFLYEIPPELVEFAGPEKLKEDDEIYLI